MSGASGDRSTANCAIRFSCSERTPRMKKLPSPTASSTMRTWLPGRLELQHRVAQREPPRLSRAAASALISSEPARCSTSAVAARPTVDDQPDAPRSGLPHRQRRPARQHDQRRSHDLHAVEPAAVAASSRSSSDGFTCRTSSSGTSENSSDTSRPMPDALQHAPAASRRSRRRRRAWPTAGQRSAESPRWRRAASSTPSALPASPSTSTCAM